MLNLHNVKTNQSYEIANDQMTNSNDKIQNLFSIQVSKIQIFFEV